MRALLIPAIFSLIGFFFLFFISMKVLLVYCVGHDEFFPHFLWFICYSQEIYSLLLP